MTQSEIRNPNSKITGQVWKYGDGVNTDVIFPGKYTYSLKDPDETPHALEDLDPAFATEAQPGCTVAGATGAMEVRASRPCWP
jgi:3-isopropylmalate dehydratase small subunit